LKRTSSTATSIPTKSSSTMLIGKFKEFLG
jgi:hypothetical protein